MIAGKNSYGREFEATIGSAGVELLRPARKGEPPRPGARFFRPLRQTIESILDTAKGQLDLEGHGGHTITGVAVRVYQRLLALTAAIWHNDNTNQSNDRYGPTTTDYRPWKQLSSLMPVAKRDLR